MFVNTSYYMRTELRRHRLRDVNAPLPSCLAALPMGLSAGGETAFIQTCRPRDRQSGSILYLEPTGTEEEHLFRVNYRQRFSLLNVQAGYTANLAFADTVPSNNAGIPTDSYDLTIDWGRAPFPVHRFETTFNAELPLGLFLLGRYSARSGQGYSILTGRDNNRDGRVTERPDGIERNTERGESDLQRRLQHFEGVLLCERFAERQRFCEHEQRVQPPESGNAFGCLDVAQFRPVDQRPEPAGDRDGDAVPVLSRGIRSTGIAPATGHRNGLETYCQVKIRRRKVRDARRA